VSCHDLVKHVIRKTNCLYGNDAWEVQQLSQTSERSPSDLDVHISKIDAQGEPVGSFRLLVEGPLLSGNRELAR